MRRIKEEDDSQAPPKRVKLQEQRMVRDDPKHTQLYFDLNIDTILEHWSVVDAVRELLANAFDEQILSQAAKMPEIQTAADGSCHIRDYGRGLQVKHLKQMEDETKKAHPHTIGRFGIGLKDSLATLDRHRITVTVNTAHHDLGLARRGKTDFEEEKTLHATVKPPSIPDMEGTEFILTGVKVSDIEAAKKLFLFFAEQNVLETTTYGDVLERGDGGNGIAYIYINGMRVAEEPNFLFSYNITNLTKSIEKGLNRERRNLGRSVFSNRVKDMLLACRSVTIAEKLTQDLQLHDKGEGHKELEWVAVQEHALKTLNSKADCVFVTSDELLRHPGTVDAAVKAGRTIVNITNKLKTRIKDSTDVDGNLIVTQAVFSQRLREAYEFKWVETKDLTNDEYTIWMRKDDILAHVGGPPAALKQIRISQEITNEIAGSCKSSVWRKSKGLLILSRQQLSSERKFAGSLLHAAIRAKFPDNVEGELVKLCGSLVSRRIYGTECLD